MGAYGEVALHEDAVGAVVIERLVVVGEVVVVIGCAEAVEDVAENVGQTVGTDHLGHVRGCHKHLVNLVDVTVHADDVLTFGEDAGIVDVAAVFSIVVGPLAVALKVEDEADVVVGDVLLEHLSFEEVDNHGRSVVDGHADAHLRRACGGLAFGTFGVTGSLVEAVPEVGIVRVFGLDEGQVVGVPEGDAVGDAGGRGLAQAEVLLATGAVGHHLQHVGIVEHGVVQQVLLLCQAEFVVRVHTGAVGCCPCGFLEELLEGCVVGCEDGLATGLRQHIGVVKVVDESERVLEIATRFQFVVDASAQETRLVVVEVVVV